MRDCANCFHRKPVLKEDGTWTAECEKWDCEFQSRENMIEKTKAMNNDLISREALLNAIHKVIEEAFGSDDIYDKGYNNGLYKASELIDNAPTVHGIVAFVERPKGEWIADTSHCYNDDEDTFECSVCKEPFTLICGTPKDNLYNFCPNCGADMRGEKE